VVWYNPVFPGSKLVIDGAYLGIPVIGSNLSLSEINGTGVHHFLSARLRCVLDRLRRFHMHETEFRLAQNASALDRASAVGHARNWCSRLGGRRLVAVCRYRPYRIISVIGKKSS
jgi:hypothetical protein